jgi:hypothetical protein
MLTDTSGGTAAFALPQGNAQDDRLSVHLQRGLFFQLQYFNVGFFLIFTGSLYNAFISQAD